MRSMFLVRLALLGLALAASLYLSLKAGFDPLSPNPFGTVVFAATVFVVTMIDLLTKFDQQRRLRGVFEIWWRATSDEPPRLAAALLWYLSPARTRDAKLDDLDEIFETNVHRHGYRTACRLYRWDVLRSVGPTLMDVGFQVAAG